MLSVVVALCHKSIKIQGEKVMDTTTNKGQERPANTANYLDAVG